MSALYVAAWQGMLDLAELPSPPYNLSIFSPHRSRLGNIHPHSPIWRRSTYERTSWNRRSRRGGHRHPGGADASLADWIREGKPSVANAEHARHVIDIVEAGYRAAATGETQTLRTSFEPLPIEAL